MPSRTQEDRTSSHEKGEETANEEEKSGGGGGVAFVLPVPAPSLSEKKKRRTKVFQLRSPLLSSVTDGSCVASSACCSFPSLSSSSSMVWSDIQVLERVLAIAVESTTRWVATSLPFSFSSVVEAPLSPPQLVTGTPGAWPAHTVHPSSTATSSSSSRRLVGITHYGLLSQILQRKCEVISMLIQEGAQSFAYAKKAKTRKDRKEREARGERQWQEWRMTRMMKEDPRVGRNEGEAEEEGVVVKEAAAGSPLGEKRTPTRVDPCSPKLPTTTNSSPFPSSWPLCPMGSGEPPSSPRTAASFAVIRETPMLQMELNLLPPGLDDEEYHEEACFYSTANMEAAEATEGVPPREEGFSVGNPSSSFLTGLRETSFPSLLPTTAPPSPSRRGEGGTAEKKARTALEEEAHREDTPATSEAMIAKPPVTEEATKKPPVGSSSSFRDSIHTSQRTESLPPTTTKAPQAKAGREDPQRHTSATPWGPYLPQDHGGGETTRNELSEQDWRDVTTTLLSHLRLEALPLHWIRKKAGVPFTVFQRLLEEEARGHGRERRSPSSHPERYGVTEPALASSQRRSFSHSSSVFSASVSVHEDPDGNPLPPTSTRVFSPSPAAPPLGVDSSETEQEKDGDATHAGCSGEHGTGEDTERDPPTDAARLSILFFSRVRKEYLLRLITVVQGPNPMLCLSSLSEEEERNGMTTSTRTPSPIGELPWERTRAPSSQGITRHGWGHPSTFRPRWMYGEHKARGMEAMRYSREEDVASGRWEGEGEAGVTAASRPWSPVAPVPEEDEGKIASTREEDGSGMASHETKNEPYSARKTSSTDPHDVVGDAGGTSIAAAAAMPSCFPVLGPLPTALSSCSGSPFSSSASSLPLQSWSGGTGRGRTRGHTRPGTPAKEEEEEVLSSRTSRSDRRIPLMPPPLHGNASTTISTAGTLSMTWVWHLPPPPLVCSGFPFLSSKEERVAPVPEAPQPSSMPSSQAMKEEEEEGRAKACLPQDVAPSVGSVPGVSPVYSSSFGWPRRAVPMAPSLSTGNGYQSSPSAVSHHFSFPFFFAALQWNRTVLLWSDGKVVESMKTLAGIPVQELWDILYQREAALGKEEGDEEVHEAARMGKRWREWSTCRALRSPRPPLGTAEGRNAPTGGSSAMGIPRRGGQSGARRGDENEKELAIAGYGGGVAFSPGSFFPPASPSPSMTPSPAWGSFGMTPPATFGSPFLSASPPAPLPSPVAFCCSPFSYEDGARSLSPFAASSPPFLWYPDRTAGGGVEALVGREGEKVTSWCRLHRCPMLLAGYSADTSEKLSWSGFNVSLRQRTALENFMEARKKEATQKAYDPFSFSSLPPSSVSAPPLEKPRREAPKSSENDDEAEAKEKREEDELFGWLQCFVGSFTGHSRRFLHRLSALRDMGRLLLTAAESFADVRVLVAYLHMALSHEEAFLRMRLERRTQERTWQIEQWQQNFPSVEGFVASMKRSPREAEGRGITPLSSPSEDAVALLPVPEPEMASRDVSTSKHKEEGEASSKNAPDLRFPLTQKDEKEIHRLLRQEAQRDEVDATERYADTMAHVLWFLHLTVEFALSQRARYLFRQQLIMDGTYGSMLSQQLDPTLSPTPPLSATVSSTPFVSLTHGESMDSPGDAMPLHVRPSYVRTVEGEAIRRACGELLEHLTHGKCASMAALDTMGIPIPVHPAPFSSLHHKEKRFPPTSPPSSPPPLATSHATQPNGSHPRATASSSVAEEQDSRWGANAFSNEPLVVHVMQIILHFSSSYATSRIYQHAAEQEEKHFNVLFSTFMLVQQQQHIPPRSKKGKGRKEEKAEDSLSLSSSLLHRHQMKSKRMEMGTAGCGVLPLAAAAAALGSAPSATPPTTRHGSGSCHLIHSSSHSLCTPSSSSSFASPADCLCYAYLLFTQRYHSTSACRRSFSAVPRSKTEGDSRGGKRRASLSRWISPSSEEEEHEGTYRWQKKVGWKAKSTRHRISRGRREPFFHSQRSSKESVSEEEACCSSSCSSSSSLSSSSFGASTSSSSFSSSSSGSSSTSLTNRGSPPQEREGTFPVGDQGKTWTEGLTATPVTASSTSPEGPGASRRSKREKRAHERLSFDRKDGNHHSHHHLHPPHAMCAITKQGLLLPSSSSRVTQRCAERCCTIALGRDPMMEKEKITGGGSTLLDATRREYAVASTIRAAASPSDGTAVPEGSEASHGPHRHLTCEPATPPPLHGSPETIPNATKDLAREEVRTGIPKEWGEGMPSSLGSLPLESLSATPMLWFPSRGAIPLLEEQEQDPEEAQEWRTCVPHLSCSVPWTPTKTSKHHLEPTRSLLCTPSLSLRLLTILYHVNGVEKETLIVTEKDDAPPPENPQEPLVHPPGSVGPTSPGLDSSVRRNAAGQRSILSHSKQDGDTSHPSPASAAGLLRAGWTVRTPSRVWSRRSPAGVEWIPPASLFLLSSELNKALYFLPFRIRQLQPSPREAKRWWRHWRHLHQQYIQQYYAKAVEDIVRQTELDVTSAVENEEEKTMKGTEEGMNPVPSIPRGDGGGMPLVNTAMPSSSFSSFSVCRQEAADELTVHSAGVCRDEKEKTPQQKDPGSEAATHASQDPMAPCSFSLSSTCLSKGVLHDTGPEGMSPDGCHASQTFPLFPTTAVSVAPPLSSPAPVRAASTSPRSPRPHCVESDWHGSGGAVETSFQARITLSSEALVPVGRETPAVHAFTASERRGSSPPPTPSSSLSMPATALHGGSSSTAATASSWWTYQIVQPKTAAEISEQRKRPIRVAGKVNATLLRSSLTSLPMTPATPRSVPTTPDTKGKQEKVVATMAKTIAPAVTTAKTITRSDPSCTTTASSSSLPTRTPPPPPLPTPSGMLTIAWDLPPFFLPGVRLDISAFTAASIETQESMKKMAAELSVLQAAQDAMYRQQYLASVVEATASPATFPLPLSPGPKQEVPGGVRPSGGGRLPEHEDGYLFPSSVPQDRAASSDGKKGTQGVKSGTVASTAVRPFYASFLSPSSTFHSFASASLSSLPFSSPSSAPFSFEPSPLCMLDGAMRHVLHDALPFTSQFMHWKVLYSTATHGCSLQTLYQCLAAASHHSTTTRTSPTSFSSFPSSTSTVPSMAGPTVGGSAAGGPNPMPMLLLMEVLPSVSWSFERDGEGVQEALRLSKARAKYLTPSSTTASATRTPNRLIIGAYLTHLLLCDVTRRYYGNNDCFVFQVMIPGEAEPTPPTEKREESAATAPFHQEGGGASLPLFPSIAKKGGEAKPCMHDLRRTVSATVMSSSAPSPPSVTGDVPAATAGSTGIPLLSSSSPPLPTLKVYRSSRENTQFINCRKTSVVIGGATTSTSSNHRHHHPPYYIPGTGCGSAIFLDQSLTHGATATCPTFHSAPLTECAHVMTGVGGLEQGSSSSSISSSVNGVKSFEIIRLEALVFEH